MSRTSQDVGPALHVRGSRASKQNYWFTKGACKCIIYTCVGPQNSTCPTELRRKQSSSSQSQKIQSAGSKRRLLRDVRETSAFPSCAEAWNGILGGCAGHLAQLGQTVGCPHQNLLKETSKTSSALFLLPRLRDARGLPPLVVGVLARSGHVLLGNRPA